MLLNTRPFLHGCALRPEPTPSVALMPPLPRCTTMMSSSRSRSSLLSADTQDPAPLRPRVATSETRRVFTLNVCAALVGTLAAFTLCFSKLERWSVVDALYFTSTTMATIGFGDLRPVSRAGRVLTSLLGICGVGLLGGLVSATLGEWMQPTAVWVEPTEAAAAAAAAAGEDSEADETAPQVAARPVPRLRWRRRREWQPNIVTAAISQASILVGVGIVGLKVCEGPRLTWATAVYLLTGTLTTAGLGDVVPTTQLSKLFLAVYAPLAVITFARVLSTLALQPLESARRAAQRAILTQYGGALTPRTLRELASGPVVKRLGLSQNDAYCSRDEFTLLMLVLQGKIGEADLREVRQTFAALDADGTGRLSLADLELVRQQRMLRLSPLLRRRTIRRVVRTGSRVLQPGTATIFERVFPHWRKARGRAS